MSASPTQRLDEAGTSVDPEKYNVSLGGSDVRLIAGLDGQFFNVHRVLLALKSDVLRDRLNSCTQPTSSHQQVELVLDGETAQSVDILLHCLYHQEQVAVEQQNFSALGELADRYGITSISAQCREFLEQKSVHQLNAKNIVSWARFGMKFGASEAFWEVCETKLGSLYGKLSDADKHSLATAVPPQLLSNLMFLLHSAATQYRHNQKEKHQKELQKVKTQSQREREELESEAGAIYTKMNRRLELWERKALEVYEETKTYGKKAVSQLCQAVYAECDVDYRQKIPNLEAPEVKRARKGGLFEGTYSLPTTADVHLGVPGTPNSAAQNGPANSESEQPEHPEGLPSTSGVQHPASEHVGLPIGAPDDNFSGAQQIGGAQAKGMGEGVVEQQGEQSYGNVQVDASQVEVLEPSAMQLDGAVSQVGLQLAQHSSFASGAGPQGWHAEGHQPLYVKHESVAEPYGHFVK